MAYQLKSHDKITSVTTSQVLDLMEREEITSQLGALSAHSPVQGLIINHQNTHIDMTMDDAVNFAESIIKLHSLKPLLFIYVIVSTQNRFIIDTSVSLAAAKSVPIYVCEDEREALDEIDRRFPNMFATERAHKYVAGDTPEASFGAKSRRLQLVKNAPEEATRHSDNAENFTNIQQSDPGVADRLAAKGLSRRESECLLAAANGMTEKETARLLGISPNTVSVHIANCRVKLNARNKLAAVIKGIGLIDERTWCRHCELISGRTA